eukprot:gnl/TRDRNA2_/TRDRNA2_37258_c1_seq1.p2 gnl/TRDRNA2_/TRDRNA2_37258_c1~~gnl/TRDRNA2_/TRDRNA2_37258_c1_seq1.p2  ORF type:complete len:154 (-),score=45.25 gnl/TRDRNA2_/TRDRNA2_37258_c1_seq1:81-497(-)
MDSDDESVSDGFPTFLTSSHSEKTIFDTSHLTEKVESEKRWQSLCIVVANVFFVAGMESEDDGPVECEDAFDYEHWEQVRNRLAGVFAKAEEEAIADLEDFDNEEEWQKVGTRLAGVFADAEYESDDDTDNSDSDGDF